MQNSTYNPVRMDALDKNSAAFNAQKTGGVAAAGATTNFDLVLTDDHIFCGVSAKFTGGQDFDSVKLQIVHPTNGVVLQPADWYAIEMEKTLPIPAKIPAGLTIRVVYTNVGANPANVMVNYDLYKVLV
jgi:hypothetical protein